MLVTSMLLQHGHTALHFGAAYGHEAVVACLLQHGADATAADAVSLLHQLALVCLHSQRSQHMILQEGATPLHLASAGKHAVIEAALKAAPPAASGCELVFCVRSPAELAFMMFVC